MSMFSKMFLAFFVVYRGVDQCGPVDHWPWTHRRGNLRKNGGSTNYSCNFMDAALSNLFVNPLN